MGKKDTPSGHGARQKLGLQLFHTVPQCLRNPFLGFIAISLFSRLRSNPTQTHKHTGAVTDKHTDATVSCMELGKNLGEIRNTSSICQALILLPSPHTHFQDEIKPEVSFMFYKRTCE